MNIRRSAFCFVIIIALSGCAAPTATQDPVTPSPPMPQPFSLFPQLPEDGAGEIPQPIAFAWAGAPAGAFSTVYVQAGSAGLSPVVGCVDISTNSCVSNSELTAGQTYWWQVHVKAGDLEVWSDKSPFTVEGSLAPTALTFFRANRTLYDVPLIISPANKAEDVRMGSKIEWRPYPVGNPEYRARASTLNGTVELCRTTALQCEMPALPEGEQFALWIEVGSNDRLLAVSMPRTGVGYLAPPPLATTSPLPDEAIHGTSVKFGWLRQAAVSNNPVRVFARVGADDTFRLICETTEASCDATFSELTRFDWFAESSDGIRTIRTPTLAGRTGGPPLVPQLAYPAPHQVDVPLRTSLAWIPSGDPTGEPVIYRAEADSGDGWRLVCETVGSWCPLDVGPSPSLIRWRVTARDASGNKVTSEEASFSPIRFQTDLTPLTPRDGTRGLNTAATFEWVATVTASHSASVVEVSTDGSTWRAVCRSAVSSCEATGLPRGRAFSWRIVAEGLTRGTSPVMHAETKLPIVLLHGWTGSAQTWQEIASRLQLDGYDAVVPTFTPDSQAEHIPSLALDVASQVDADLIRLGYPSGQPFHLIGHSMGGLVGRALIEHPGAGTAFDAGGWNPSAGPKLPSDWPARVRTYTSVGTPHAGTLSIIGILCQLGGEFASISWLGATCGDMMPASSFIHVMGEAKPSSVPYNLVAGTSELGFRSWRGNLAVAILCLGAHDGLICRSSALSTTTGTIHLIDGCHSGVFTKKIPMVPVTPTCEGPLITESTSTEAILHQILADYASLAAKPTKGSPS